MYSSMQFYRLRHPSASALLPLVLCDLDSSGFLSLLCRPFPLLLSQDSGLSVLFWSSSLLESEVFCKSQILSRMPSRTLVSLFNITIFSYS
jgi:hypothetical protein